jgi:hypothetical protein
VVAQPAKAAAAAAAIVHLIEVRIVSPLTARPPVLISKTAVRESMFR